MFFEVTDYEGRAILVNSNLIERINVIDGMKVRSQIHFVHSTLRVQETLPEIKQVLMKGVNYGRG
jgi:hypothetical protein